MNINIDDKFRIINDEYQFILQEKKIKGEKSKNPGKEYWVKAKFPFCNTIESVLHSYKKNKIFTAEGINTFEKLQEELNKIDNTINKVVQELNV
jgi:NAD+--asparagine ADP-ribosyltransferase